MAYSDGCYLMSTGLKLIGQVLAGECSMNYTRVAFGSGYLDDDDENPASASEVAGYVVDGTISAISEVSDGQCQVSVQISSENVDSAFYCTGIMLYAEDPDGEDTPYAYVVLENAPEYIRDSSSTIAKIAVFNLVVVVGDVDTVTAELDTESLATIATVKTLIAASEEELKELIETNADSIENLAANVTELEKLTANGNTIGSGTRHVYLSNGSLVASASNVGSGTKPIYLANGVLTAASGNVGAAAKYIYMLNGALTAANTTIGSSTRLIYLNAGTFAASTSNIGSGTRLSYMTNGSLVNSSSNTGAYNRPVYQLNGAITQCIQNNMTALGYGATANGSKSTAIGNAAIANGHASTAIGSNARATTQDAIAVGENANAASGNCAIAIGHNTACTGEYAIAVGHVAVCNGLRSTVYGGSANAASGANYSTALGYNAYAASGACYATAVGYNSRVFANRAVALGDTANAAAYEATALGALATASCNTSLAAGAYSSATSWYTTAVGANSAASYNYSAAFGYNAAAAACWASAIGYNTKASGGGTTALGDCANASGNHATALGTWSEASATNSTAVGRSASCANANGLQLGDAATLSTLTCKVSLTTTSDIRDKADIAGIDDGATAFLKLVTPIRYVYNGRIMYIDTDNLSDEDKANKAKYGLCTYDTDAWEAGTKKGTRVRVGVSAQEVQQALETVYGSSDYANIVNDNLHDFDADEIPDGVESQLAIGYEEFVPFLIKAVQELDARISTLEA